MIWLGMVLMSLLALHLVLLALVYSKGHRHARASFPDKMADVPPVDEFTDQALSATMIVPLTGDAPGMRNALSSLLDQDYPGLKLVFVTKDEADPGTNLIRELIKDRPRARHVLAGPSQRCGQKNHNLLAAVREVGDSAEVLVFCDSTHIAHPSLVRDLLRPMVRDGVKLTSGFHRVMPQDLRTGTLGMVLSVQLVHMLQSFAWLNQPWGGAMAVKREVFEEHGVAEVWSTNIVDDFSMGPHLVKKGIRCLGIARACMATPLSGGTMRKWSDWWMRQIYYLKFCMPLVWAAVAGLYALFLLPVIAPPLALVGWALSWWGWPVVAGVGLYMALLAALALWSRALVPMPIPLWPWLRTSFIYYPVSAVSYTRTWLSNIMSWRGISYRVGWGGRVREIIVRQTES